MGKGSTKQYDLADLSVHDLEQVSQLESSMSQKKSEKIVLVAYEQTYSDN